MFLLLHPARQVAEVFFPEMTVETRHVFETDAAEFTSKGQAVSFFDGNIVSLLSFAHSDEKVFYP